MIEDEEEIGNSTLEELANYIIENLRLEFEQKHMAKNLINTLEIYVEDGKLHIGIPARTYNMLKYQKEGVVVHTSHGSYANKLNEEGSEFFIYRDWGRKRSFLIKPHNHIGFIDRCVKKAILEWLAVNGEDESAIILDL